MADMARPEHHHGGGLKYHQRRSDERDDPTTLLPHPGGQGNAGTTRNRGSWGGPAVREAASHQGRGQQARGGLLRHLRRHTTRPSGLPLPEGFVGFVPRPRHAERQGSPCHDAGPEEQEEADSQEAQSSEGHATQDEGPPHGRCRPTKRGFLRSRTPSFTVGQLLATHLISWGLA